MQCRVCGMNLGTLIYRADSPAITSLSTRLDTETVVHVCTACGHAQSPDLPALERFYDTEYRISLASDDHDQLYDVVADQPVYRTRKQAELVLAHAAPPEGARTLDYGAAKAATLQAIMTVRPDIRPAVFDVSEDYRGHWAGWVADEEQATYRCPRAWSGRFDLVTAHFVLEHVAAPVDVFADIARLLAPGGRAFVTVPDVLSNSGDLIVVDHVNHFTLPSIRAALARAGLVADAIVPDAFRGAFVIIASRGVTADASGDIPETVTKLRRIAAFWTGARDRLLAAAAANADLPAAIYGAGFYGVFVSAALQGHQRLLGHLDRNPHVRAAASVSPVFDPADPPDGIELVYAGLNPLIARRVLSEWAAEVGIAPEFIYLDEAP